MSSTFSPESQVSKINCHVLFIDLSRDLGLARFPSQAPPHRGDGGDRQPRRQGGGQGGTSGAGRSEVPAPAMPRGCSTALGTPRFPPHTTISLAVPALALISLLPQARRGRAQ